MGLSPITSQEVLHNCFREFEDELSYYVSILTQLDSPKEAGEELIRLSMPHIRNIFEAIESCRE